MGWGGASQGPARPEGVVWVRSEHGAHDGASGPRGARARKAPLPMREGEGATAAAVGHGTERAGSRRGPPYVRPASRRAVWRRGGEGFSSSGAGEGRERPRRISPARGAR